MVLVRQKDMKENKKDRRQVNKKEKTVIKGIRMPESWSAG